MTEYNKNKYSLTRGISINSRAAFYSVFIYLFASTGYYNTHVRGIGFFFLFRTSVYISYYNFRKFFNPHDNVIQPNSAVRSGLRIALTAEMGDEINFFCNFSRGKKTTEQRV